MQGWTLDQRLSAFERNWAYFAGFGFPASLFTVIFPGFVSSGVYAFMFPMFILLAMMSGVDRHKAAEVILL